MDKLVPATMDKIVPTYDVSCDILLYPGMFERGVSHPLYFFAKSLRVLLLFIFQMSGFVDNVFVCRKIPSSIVVIFQMSVFFQCFLPPPMTKTLREMFYSVTYDISDDVWRPRYYCTFLEIQTRVGYVTVSCNNGYR